MYHNPVLLHESVDGLNINPSGIYVDLTFGGGGHSRYLLSKLNEKGKLFAFDQDADAASNAIADKRFTLIDQNFRFLKNYLKYYKAIPVDGILADLGISSHHIDAPERGFTTRFDGPLDMRMNRRQGLTAAAIVNEYPEQKLFTVFSLYGEIPNARQLASVIVKGRKAPVQTLAGFKNLIASCIPVRNDFKYLAQVFQALRIEVNHEEEALRQMLLQTVEVLKHGGRLSVISYHSLEDRLVKNFMKTGNLEGTIEKDFFGRQETPFKTITRKPVTPGDAEIQSNPRSRSAKLRIAERI